ncbi:6636_t:CDS:1, partial [Gigaspora margarita]
MKEFFSSFYEEVYNDFSQEFSTNIESEEINNEKLTFDQCSLNKLNEILSQS